MSATGDAEEGIEASFEKRGRRAGRRTNVKPGTSRSPDERVAVGLCAGCAHGHRVLSARGSVFWLCRRAAKDAAFVRYPRLPMLRCPGYEQEAREP